MFPFQVQRLSEAEERFGNLKLKLTNVYVFNVLSVTVQIRLCTAHMCIVMFYNYYGQNKSV